MLKWQILIGFVSIYDLWFTSFSKMARKEEHRASSLTRTLSYIKGKSFHPSFPLSGPNIGWVHTKSESWGASLFYPNYDN